MAGAPFIRTISAFLELVISTECFNGFVLSVRYLVRWVIFERLRRGKNLKQWLVLFSLGEVKTIFNSKACMVTYSLVSNANYYLFLVETISSWMVLEDLCGCECLFKHLIFHSCFYLVV